ncbi:hypothetical protein BHM03_00056960 [Ensete ventricosum]|nr:hypothetical protein BHM03_00056960 [Ensete ventricosum]
MQLRTSNECIWSLLGVSRACQDGVREFARRRPRLAGRLSRVAEKLAGSIKKITRNMPGDRQRKTLRLAAGEAGGCQFTGIWMEKMKEVKRPPL